MENNTLDQLPDDEPIELKMEVVFAMAQAFPLWMQKLINLFENQQYVDLPKYLQSLRTDELEQAMNMMRIAHAHDVDNGKNFALLTMLFMIAQGYEITKLGWTKYTTNVAGMFMATYMHKRNEGKANFDKFDMGADPNLYITFFNPDNLTGEIQDAH